MLVRPNLTPFILKIFSATLFISPTRPFSIITSRQSCSSKCTCREEITCRDEARVCACCNSINDSVSFGLGERFRARLGPLVARGTQPQHQGEPARARRLAGAPPNVPKSSKRMIFGSNPAMHGSDRGRYGERYPKVSRE